jgi:GNAT superfamily N-acetyltransferase
VFTLRPFDVRDFAALTVLRNLSRPEPSSVLQTQEWYENGKLISNHYHLWIAANEEDQAIGYGSLIQNDYLPPGRWNMAVGVHPEHARQGIGQALFSTVERIALENGAESFGAYVTGDARGDDSVAWAERRGYAVDRTRTESVLYLKGWDGSRFADHQSVESTGLRLETMTALPETDAFLEKLYDFHAETVPDVPDFEPPFPTYDTWVKEFRGEAKDKTPIVSIFAWDGDRIVGESTIGLPRCEGAGAYTHYTGVRRSYRGRGLALALKLRTIEAAVAHGVPHMRTNNDPDNPSMLAVNAKLGYVMIPGPRRLKKYVKGAPDQV